MASQSMTCSSRPPVSEPTLIWRPRRSKGMTDQKGRRADAPGLRMPAGPVSLMPITRTDWDPPVESSVRRMSESLGPVSLTMSSGDAISTLPLLPYSTQNLKSRRTRTKAGMTTRAQKSAPPPAETWKESSRSPTLPSESVTTTSYCPTAAPLRSKVAYSLEESTR